MRSAEYRKDTESTQSIACCRHSYDNIIKKRQDSPVIPAMTGLFFGDLTRLSCQWQVITEKSGHPTDKMFSDDTSTEGCHQKKSTIDQI